MTIEIPINSSLYHVEIDGSNYNLTKDSGEVNAKTGKMPVTQIGYFTDIKQVVKRITNDQIGLSNKKVDLKGFLQEFNAIKEEIEALVS